MFRVLNGEEDPRADSTPHHVPSRGSHGHGAHLHRGTIPGITGRFAMCHHVRGQHFSLPAPVRVLGQERICHSPCGETSVSTIGGCGDTTIPSLGRSPKQPLPGIGLRHPHMVGKLGPNSTHFIRGLVKYILCRGSFRAVPSQNGDKFVTSPPPHNR